MTTIRKRTARRLLSLAVVIVALAIGAPSRATISVLQTVQNSDPDQATSGTTIAVAVTVATTGNLLHLYTTWGGSGAISTVTDTGSNTWTLRSSPANGPFGTKSAAYTTTAGASGAITVTVTFGSANTKKGIAVAEIGGASAYQTQAVNSQAAPGTGTDAVSTGNMTPTSQPALLHAWVMNGNENAAPGTGTGFTAGINTWQFDLGAAIMRSESKRVTSTSAVPATFTATSGGDTYISAGAVFTETSGGATVLDGNFFGGGP